MLWVAIGQAPGLFLYSYLGTLGQLGLNLARGKTHPRAMEYLIWLGGFASAAVVLMFLGRIALRLLQDVERNTTPSNLAPLELSWQELLATLAVFLLPAVTLLLRQSPPESGALGLPSALIFLAAMLVVGVLRRLPLRSLPYLGAILVIAAYLFLFQWVADLVSPALISNFAPGPWDHSTHLLLKAASTGMLWLTLFCLTLLVIAFLALYNRFQPLCWRIRHDWSLLSFLLHGEAVFTLLLLVERHRTERPFAIACLLWLAAGAWFYLRTSQRWKRAIALVSGLSLGIWAVASGVIFTAGGNLVLSSRAIIDLGEPSSFAMLGEAAGRILIVPIWILLVLLLPAWFSRLSQLSRGIRNKGV